MSGRLESKVIVVTGATSGIGMAVAERLAYEGAIVVIGARRKDIGENVAAGINRAGGRAVFVPTDVTVEEDLAALVRTAVEKYAPYVTAKHAVIGLTRASALETAARRIRINALASGAVDTPAFRSTLGSTPDQATKIAALHPLGRIAGSDEIAAFAAFLLSDESRFITGAALAIDGGFTAR